NYGSPRRQHRGREQVGRRRNLHHHSSCSSSVHPIYMSRTKDAQPITILMADDDADDRQLTREALEDARLVNDMRFVEHGEELLEYLRHQGNWAAPAEAPRPGLILLDLNMPRKAGRTVLKE